MRIPNYLTFTILPAISALWLAIGVGIIGSETPHYSHISEFMSALGATGAPFAAWTNFAVFLPAGILMLVFIVALLRNRKPIGLGQFPIVLLLSYVILLICIAFLTCDAGCRTLSGEFSNTANHIAHMVIAAIAYPIAMIGFLLLGRSSPPYSLLHRSAFPAFYIGTCLFLAIIAWPHAQGLFQRLTEAWIYLQFLLVGLYAETSLRE